MKKVIIGIVVGVVLSHLYIAVSNDLRLRGQYYAGSMIGNAMKQREFCKQYGKKAVISWDFDYGIYTHSACTR